MLPVPYGGWFDVLDSCCAAIGFAERLPKIVSTHT